jgi:hypothetical protein
MWWEYFTVTTYFFDCNYDNCGFFVVRGYFLYPYMTYITVPYYARGPPSVFGFEFSKLRNGGFLLCVSMTKQPMKQTQCKTDLQRIL